MPIIGPILLSLFIFSPLIVPTSDANKSSELALDSTSKEPLLSYDQPQPILESSDKEQHNSLPKQWQNIGKICP